MRLPKGLTGSSPVYGAKNILVAANIGCTSDSESEWSEFDSHRGYHINIFVNGDIMKFKDLFENYKTKYYFAGTCVNSFDNDSCSFSNYSDVSDFAVAEENAKSISRSEFLEKVGDVPDSIINHLSKNLDFLHDEDNDVFMIYDKDSDIHYFFI